MPALLPRGAGIGFEIKLVTRIDLALGKMGIARLIDIAPDISVGWRKPAKP